MVHRLSALFLLLSCLFVNHAFAQSPTVTWDSQSLIMDGKRIVPVMGEIHYSRLPEGEWQTELKKMKDGGVTIIATYVFWNHIEETEGVFNWSGQRNLRHFIELCKEQQLPVVLRLGPFCHGEVRNGGIPDWLFSKGCKMRSEDSTFLFYTERLYRQIFTQVQGLQWKDGGPVIACQFDNEYRGHGSYLMSLKKIALRIGYDLPFFTRTGWPELRTPVPYGEMIPLYGDYADGFWDKEVKEGVGNYWKAFHFKAFRSSTAIGTDLLGKQEEHISKSDHDYPYFTCELGGGMVTSYHRRVYMYPIDALSMAVVKLGSGSNLLGYYMYHGGTNPEGNTTLNETQHTLGTANNDLPVKSYEFQAPLGEFGQVNPTYYTLRPLHLFMQDFGETLAPMNASFPCADKESVKHDDSYLRWSYRSSAQSGFVFVNNYERFANLTAKKNIQFDVCGIRFPSNPMTIPASCVAIFPVNVEGITYSTAQLVSKRNGNIYLMQVKGVPTELKVGNRLMRNLKPKGLAKPIYKNIYLLNEEEAQRLFLENHSPNVQQSELSWKKLKEAGTQRQIVKGPAKVAEAPTDDDYRQAAVYQIDITANDRGLMEIQYQGDCARLYAGGKLVADNFYNGKNFYYGLWRLPKDVHTLELRILPMQANEPVYFPKEADTSVGERVVAIKHIVYP